MVIPKPAIFMHCCQVKKTKKFLHTPHADLFSAIAEQLPIKQQSVKLCYMHFYSLNYSKIYNIINYLCNSFFHTCLILARNLDNYLL